MSSSCNLQSPMALPLFLSSVDWCDGLLPLEPQAVAATHSALRCAEEAAAAAHSEMPWWIICVWHSLLLRAVNYAVCSRSRVMGF